MNTQFLVITIVNKFESFVIEIAGKSSQQSSMLNTKRSLFELNA